MTEYSRKEIDRIYKKIIKWHRKHDDVLLSPSSSSSQYDAVVIASALQQPTQKSVKRADMCRKGSLSKKSVLSLSHTTVADDEDTVHSDDSNGSHSLRSKTRRPSSISKLSALFEKK
jgi:hypothetical protein